MDRTHLRLEFIIVFGLQRGNKQLCLLGTKRALCPWRSEGRLVGIAQPVLPCQQAATAQPMAPFGYHHGSLGGKNLLPFLSLVHWQEQVSHSFCMPLRLTALSFRFLSPYSSQIHLSLTCFHLGMMFLPVVSCACPDLQTPATRTKGIRGMEMSSSQLNLKRGQQVAECLQLWEYIPWSQFSARSSLKLWK